MQLTTTEIDQWIDNLNQTLQTSTLNIENLLCQALEDLPDSNPFEYEKSYWYSKYAITCSKKYTRNLIFKNDLLEVMVFVWSPGQFSSIHNHGPSTGAMKVIVGEMESQLFQTDDDIAKPLPANTLYQGTIMPIVPEIIHRQGCANNANLPAISIHIYSPPLVEATIFNDPNSDLHTEFPYCNTQAQCPSVVSGGTGPCIR